VSLLIHSLLHLLVVWNMFICSLDYHSIYYNCFILHLASCAREDCLDLFPWWAHWLFTFFLPCSYGLDHCSYGLGPKESMRFYVNALVMTHVCSVMLFVSHIVIVFSLMVLPLLWDEFLWWSKIFLLWNMSSEPSLFVGFLVLRWFSQANFSISYSSLRCLIVRSSFWALEIA
jgi:hypothetical protein